MGCASSPLALRRSGEGGIVGEDIRRKKKKCFECTLYFVFCCGVCCCCLINKGEKEVEGSSSTFFFFFFFISLKTPFSEEEIQQQTFWSPKSKKVERSRSWGMQGGFGWMVFFFFPLLAGKDPKKKTHKGHLTWRVIPRDLTNFWVKQTKQKQPIGMMSSLDLVVNYAHAFVERHHISLLRIAVTTTLTVNPIIAVRYLIKRQLRKFQEANEDMASQR